MIFSVFQIAWIALAIFQVGISGHFLSLYKKDGDNRKLMFGIAFLIGVFAIFYNISQIHNTPSEPVWLNNLYYWSFLPILIAIFSVAHHTLFNLKKFSLFFKSFVFFVVFSLFFLLFLPFPAEEFFSPVIIGVGIEILIVSLVLFIQRRRITDFIFLLAALSFMMAGMSIRLTNDEYFQIFAFFIGYVFFLLIFAYPNAVGKDKGKGMGDIFALRQELSETNKALQLTAERYHDLFEHIKSGVVVYKPFNDGEDFVIKDFNSAAEKIEKIKRDEVIGKRVTEVFPGVKDFGVFDVFKQVLVTGIPKKHPVSYYSDGRVHGWRDTTVYRLSTGEIVAVYDDVTKKKQDELALKQAHQHLKQMNEELDQKVEQRTAEIQRLLDLKDNFIHQIGHDLKNPLGPLIHLIPLLEKNDTNSKNKEIYMILKRNVTHIRNIIDKTVRLAQLNASSTLLELQNLNLSQQINEILDRNTFLFKDKDIAVHSDVNEEIDIQADKLLLAELFDNLLGNAVKYNEHGGKIEIDAVDGDGFVTISVSDTGMGMNDEQIDHVFDEFYKADGSRHDFDSSGLGMSIAKRIVEKHGGNIWVESNGPGLGSTFFFTLPKKESRKICQNDSIPKK